jgi:glycosyltransferase involved in cell wall biosynthesis
VNILFLSHTPIGSPFVVGSHHLAREFAKLGHQVIHIPYPLSLAHRVLGKQRFGARLGLVMPRLWQIVPQVILPIKSIAILFQSNPEAKSIASQILLLMEEVGLKGFDYCFMDDPSFQGVAELLPISRRIYRPTDIYAYMPGSRGLAKMEQQAIQLSDGVVCTNQKIADYHANLLENKELLVVENGFDYNHFSDSPARTGGEMGVISACYIGAIDERFDKELLLNISPKLEKFRMDIYSPTNPKIRAANIFWKGIAKYEDLPSILARYNLLVMPFNSHKANYGRSPMKLFEYASVAVPMLVPNYIDTYSLEGVYKYGNADEFVEVVMNIDYSKSISRSKATLARHSWAVKAGKILHFAELL